MKLLALETIGTQMGACLWEDLRPRGFKTEKGGDNLMPLLDTLFRKAAWSPADLDAVAVDVGPGRFTGIRIGVTAARTLGQVLQKPVVEVNSLEAMAAQGAGWEAGKSFVWKFPHDLLCVLSEALHDEIYMAVWRFHRLADRGRTGAPERASHTFGHHFKLVHAPSLFPFGRFLSFFQSCFQQQTLLFVGPGAHRYRKSLQGAFKSRARFGPALENVDVRWVAALGSEKFFRREVKSFGQVQPLYLRPSYVEERLGQNTAQN
ncbi:MAG TPA: tRNA (adenosine(37)-N6)-threonylcarbamoyltransferase complex dimerization subunit type 1 TsaB [Elusimicrobiota bacterium]|nr:tRNA (adenosine(37)-N6)-threonylcarbamoyltransferase complex dimerization subunit type 1 TsaB [Elusimicrobiota bacterium]